MTTFVSLADWLCWQETLHPRSIDLSLERVKQVFQALCPNYRKPLTLTIAGTNGKGSCAALLEAMLRAAGYQVGTYTSPHLVRYNERIRINGKEVDDAALIAAFTQIEAVRAGISLSYFEFSTLAALYLFSQAHLDVQILEVGMGGRLDAVNIIDTDVAMITSIGIDHAEWLGPTRAHIAREKAGVFRPQTPVVCAEIDPPECLLAYAETLNAPLLLLNRDFNVTRHVNSWSVRGGPRQHYTGLTPLPLQGDHQYHNAAAAIMALSHLPTDTPISTDAINQGLAQVRLTGRLELCDGPVPVLLDVGHNPQAAQTLLDYLSTRPDSQRIHALFTMMKDKDIGSVIATLKDRVHHWYYVPLPDNPRCADRTAMADAFLREHVSQVTLTATSFVDALKTARKHCQNGDLLLIFGSFFLVSEYLRTHPN
ncbi:MAG: bifunctional tetrahydrofolate synthase/dihydrofolate synthase [Methylococcales bacterium]|nr:bifunctional tetrahydrofolate synthase/dihydrofolate synthase [Methylococcales bacterium]